MLLRPRRCTTAIYQFQTSCLVWVISLFSLLIHFLNRDLIDVGLDQYGSDDDEDEAASSSRQLHIDLDSSIEERSQVLA